MRNRLKYYIILITLFLLVGCITTKEAVDRYEACKGDPVCVEQMETLKDNTYSITKTTTKNSIPTFSEAVAVIISNVVAFGFGVWKGKKRG